MSTQVRFSNVSKRFFSKADTSRSLAAFLWSGFKGTPQRERWALKDLSFEIQAGERVAIMGHNGAGKSTLLRLIADTLVPCSGRIEVNGSVAPIAGISGGFDGRLSGRDNLVLRASLFGLSSSQIGHLLPRVIEFAELEEAIDLPVATYSSGMVARLGFALSIHLQAQIYLIDEGLTAGDPAFRAKARKAMEERIRGGGTWLIVSHDLGPVQDFCQRALLLERGQLVRSGRPEELMELAKPAESPATPAPA